MAGHKVKVPFRDTDQDDEIGLRICEEHEKDILYADEIHIFLYPKLSEGWLYDFAYAKMAKQFFPKKKIVLVNINEVKITKKKSYTNVTLATHFGLSLTTTLENLKNKKIEHKK